MENNLKNINIIEEKPLSKNEVKYNNAVKHLSRRRKFRFSFDRNMKDFNIVLDVIWVFLIGLFGSLICGIAGTLYCLTIVGVPFGLILYRVIPLVFKPINKRVVLNFKDFWFFNVLWLFCGGFIIAMFFEIVTLLFYITIIGIPIGRQIKKIATVFWAPFGAEILEIDEFSDELKEQQAYTVQYIRKNKISIDFEKLNVDEKDKKRILKLTDYRYPFVYTIFRGSYSTIITALLICIYAFGIFFILNKIGFFDSFIFNFFVNTITSIPRLIHKIIFFLLSPLVKFLSLIFSLINVDIYKFIDILIDLGVIIILLLVSIEIIKLIFVLVSGIVLLRVQKKKIYTYGYASRKELIKQYDSNLIVMKKYSDLIYILYKLYEKEVNKEILNDVPTRKKEV